MIIDRELLQMTQVKRRSLPVVHCHSTSHIRQYGRLTLCDNDRSENEGNLDDTVPVGTFHVYGMDLHHWHNHWRYIEAGLYGFSDADEYGKHTSSI